ncbi:MAG: hypothetical protein N4A40_12790 [Tissierellales bacterium]|jgi:hypothetical protein|nr:hypothetical protein [Tissierellales bacterium]
MEVLFLIVCLSVVLILLLLIKFTKIFNIENVYYLIEQSREKKLKPNISLYDDFGEYMEKLNESYKGRFLDNTIVEISILLATILLSAVLYKVIKMLFEKIFIKSNEDLSDIIKFSIGVGAVLTSSYITTNYFVYFVVKIIIG